MMDEHLPNRTPEGPVYVFRDAGIELRQTDVGKLVEAIRGLREKKR